MTGRLWAIVAVVAVVAVGAGVGIGAAAWAGGDHDTAGTSMDMSGHEASSTMAGSEEMPSGALGEREFMQMMVPHHESAVEMARMALERSKRPQVLQLARAIISSQESEIANMRAWFQEWFGEELVPSMSGPHAMPDMGELKALSGPEFDRAFLAMMIAHHASAITMADEVLMGGPRKEIDTLARQIIAAQAKEIGEMQRWRERWYPPLG